VLSANVYPGVVCVFVRGTAEGLDATVYVDVVGGIESTVGVTAGDLLRRFAAQNAGRPVLLLMVPYVLVAISMAMVLRGGGGGLAALGAAGLLSIVGLICAIGLLVLMVLPSTPGENRYGPNPYGEAGVVAAE